jgi:diguanylate cyclase (GGDEF)-like protein/PAS domain S-box-containing protein
MPEADDRHQRILVIDDEPGVRGLLAGFLSETYLCAEASSAEEALGLLRSERFDLVLSDIQMGSISGLEMVPRLLELAPETVVVMVSGAGTMESAIEALRAGAFDYVTKPFDFNQVGAAVRRALDHQSLLVAHRRSERRFRQLFEHATDIIYRADSRGYFTLVNPVAATLMKRPAEELVGLHYLELVRPDYRDAVEKFYRAQFTDRIGETYYEFPAVAADGAEVWLGQNVQLLLDDDRVAGFQAVARDVTRHRFYDPATGLPNRSLFEAELSGALGGGHGGRSPAVMLIAPDRLQRFVDTLGHAACDGLLRGVAERLAACAGKENLLARFGDGEFALLLPSASGPEQVAAVARRVREALRKSFLMEVHDLYVTASIGIALPPRDGEGVQDVMKNAGAALFRVREEGGDGHRFYAAEMNAAALRRLSLESGLRRALERGEFTIHYQPQMDVVTNEVTGAEALVRWQHPEMGLVPPAEFIPLAEEENGLIVQLDEWVLRAACTQNSAWQAAGLPPLRVSSNLSARTFRQADLPEMVARVLGETGLDPDWLDLELTESSVMCNAEAAAEILRALRALGVHVSIDDFGVGHSSLNYLKRFPADCLKIDQTFVRDAAAEPHDAAIVRAIVTLARSLGLKVIAEGVETVEQLRFLRLLGCDAAQGYLLSRPLPADEFRLRFLERGVHLPRPDSPLTVLGLPAQAVGAEEDRKVRDALGLYRALAEEMKYSAFAMQALAESCDPRTADELRRFVDLCRRTRSSKSSESGRAMRKALKQADRAG